ncbi:hypothetical protein JTB14_014825 [Gonioctena quinquepunctata]|nr:hypothetical protein JTB14_014825 [Gonioctena quinquepunctata]
MNPGSGDHGLFQISQLYWCSPPGDGFGCNTPCSSFRDDSIADDVRCVKKIYKEHTRLTGDGFNAWAVYPLYCKGDTSKYVAGCPGNLVDNAISVVTEESLPVDEDDDGYAFPPLPSPPKVYNRCELARELLDVHKFPAEQISKWVCIVEHESSYDTAANNKGSGDHGLFQISEQYWCSPYSKGLACNANCASFRDKNIADDVQCIRTIYEEHAGISGDGFNAWTVYPLYCKGNTSRYTRGCFEGEDDGYEFPALPSPVEKVVSNVIGLKSNARISSPPPHFHVLFEETELSHNRNIQTTPSSSNLSKLKSDTSTKVGRTSTASYFDRYTSKKPSTHTPKSDNNASSIYFGSLFRSALAEPRQLNFHKRTRPARPSRPAGFPARPSRPTGRPLAGGPSRPPRPARPGTCRPVATSVYATSPKPLGKSLGRDTASYSGHFASLVPSTVKPVSPNTLSSTVKRSDSSTSELFPGGAVLVSFPHLLYADIEYLQSVRGLKPDKDKHETSITLEPISGTPLEVNQRVQFNIFLRPIENVMSLENISNALMPLLWVEESLILDDEYTDMLKNDLFQTIKTVDIIKWVVIGSGVACTLTALLLRMQSNPAEP